MKEGLRRKNEENTMKNEENKKDVGSLIGKYFSVLNQNVRYCS